jgi:hypothetical protein
VREDTLVRSEDGDGGVDVMCGDKEKNTGGDRNERNDTLHLN